MKWSQLKKRIEERMAESVRGRIELGTTSYRRSSQGRGWIAIDYKEVLNMSDMIFDWESWVRQDMEGKTDELHAMNIFAQMEWLGALFDYLNLSIEEILTSDNQLIRAIGMLDARVGKRRLRSMDMSQEHDLVQRLYYLRCDAEHLRGIDVPPQHQVLTTRLDPSSWSWSHQEKEKQKKLQQQALEKLAHAKDTRKIRRLINLLYNRELAEHELDTEISRIFFDGFAQTSDRDRLYQSLLLVDSKSKLLQTSAHANGVMALLQSNDKPVRPISTWEPGTYNSDRQFSSLARHLWAQYDVPIFMDRAWLKGDSVQQQWFKHLGAGRNIRTATDLPLPLTKKWHIIFWMRRPRTP